MRHLFFILFLFVFTNGFSQKRKSSRTGNVAIDELTMKQYSKDTTATAVVLYEHGNYYINENKNYNNTTDYYFKIKILKKEGVAKATIEIPLYEKETIHDIKGITYNLSEGNSIQKTHLLDSKIYTKDINKHWKEVTFTLPNIKVGSVIEYVYSVTSPYSQIDDWFFQSDIPKAQSDFTAAILGNYKYNVRMVGFLKLKRDNPSVKRGCINIPGLGEGGCLLLDYSMENIPVFKEEDYMLSKDNFLSKLAFDLKSYTSPKGLVKKYTKTWKDADRSLKLDFLDNQSTKKKFFKKQLDPAILSNANELEKATQIYQFIQRHFTWNDKYWPSKKVRVKEAFQNRSGNIFDINLALYNSLQAANIESYLVLTSTRNRAIPTRLHPIVNDFNYLLVKTIINEKTYFLDASSSYVPFGLVRYNALNGDGRVMDFKKGSYWEPIQLNKKTYKNIKTQLAFNEDGELTGNLTIATDGYFAVNERAKIHSKGDDTYIEDFESKYPNLSVEDFKFRNLKQNSKPLHQVYKVTFDEIDLSNDHIRINPFLIDKSTRNPFKLDKREYPVDYGYPSKNSYLLSLKIPSGFAVKELPQNKAFSLPNNGGRYRLVFSKTDDKINIYAQTSIHKKLYSTEEYHYLKEFYKQIISSQDVFIEFEKVNK
ncbi:conserved protein of unknown function [Tenacibaculum sp. 190130A14a]|uniref:DUF3857 domain-containing protein n=1 Tax=Tenacibaculum polynesiense TaxID=3137857 RepID=A0ABP1F7X2_9FLAO